MSKQNEILTETEDVDKGWAQGSYYPQRKLVKDKTIRTEEADVNEEGLRGQLPERKLVKDETILTEEADVDEGWRGQSSEPEDLFKKYGVKRPPPAPPSVSSVLKNPTGGYRRRTKHRKHKRTHRKTHRRHRKSHRRTHRRR